MKALIWFPTRIICSDLCLNCKPITQNYRQDVHKICISRDFLCLHCLWNLRFESNLPGSIPKILKSDRDSKALEPDPESWRFWVESSLTSRDSLRGLTWTCGSCYQSPENWSHLEDRRWWWHQSSSHLISALAFPLHSRSYPAGGYLEKRIESMNGVMFRDSK